MAIVRLFVQRNGGNGRWLHCVSLDPNIVETHLKEISRILSMRSPKQGYDVYLPRVAPGALAHVIAGLRKHRHDFKVNVHKSALPKVIALWQAVQAVGLLPAQSQIDKHIVGHISKNTIMPSDLVAIQKAFDILPKTHKFWQGVIHRLPWLFLNGNYGSKEDARQEIVRLVQTDPELKAALEQKYNELEAKTYRSHKHQNKAQLRDFSSRLLTASMPSEDDHSLPPSLQYDDSIDPEMQDWPALPLIPQRTQTKTLCPYGPIERPKPAASNQTTDTNKDHEAVPLKAFELEIQAIGKGVVYNKWKGIPTEDSVEKVRVQVTVDPKKVIDGELDEKIGKWSKAIEELFKEDT